MYVQDFKEYANESISEAMMDAYGQDEDVTSGHTFNQEKGTEKGSVKIEAAFDDMQELAKVLALAGITLPKQGKKNYCSKIRRTCDAPMMKKVVMTTMLDIV